VARVSFFVTLNLVLEIMSGNRGLFTWSARTRAIVWLACLTLITVGPIAQAAWDLHRLDAVMPGDADLTSRYLASRNPVVDDLLPGGAGGTQVVDDLGGEAGVAYPGVAAIRLAATESPALWPEAVELHERAHLVEAFLPAEVGALMARLAAPDPQEYAATGPSEHFAEMAARAWSVAVPPEGICLDRTPEEALRTAEQRVPGTAGFVAWYLRHPALGRATPHHPPLLALATKLSEPSRAEWEAVWRAMDARRLPGGGFEPWRHTSIRASLESRRLAARHSGAWMDRIVDVGLIPSVTLLAIAGR